MNAISSHLILAALLLLSMRSPAQVFVDFETTSDLTGNFNVNGGAFGVSPPGGLASPLGTASLLATAQPEEQSTLVYTPSTVRFDNTGDSVTLAIKWSSTGGEEFPGTGGVNETLTTILGFTTSNTTAIGTGTFSGAFLQLSDSQTLGGQDNEGYLGSATGAGAGVNYNVTNGPFGSFGGPTPGGTIADSESAWHAFEATFTLAGNGDIDYASTLHYLDFDGAGTPQLMQTASGNFSGTGMVGVDLFALIGMDVIGDPKDSWDEFSITTNPIPEPSSPLLLGAALLGLARRRRRP